MNKLQLTATRTETRPNSIFEKANHFKCVLSYNGKKLIFYYSKGIGLPNTPPTLKEVMYSLLLDIDFYNNDKNEYFRDVKYSQAKQMEKEVLKAKKLFGSNFSELMKRYGKDE